MHVFSGLWAPLITPFNADGALDLASLDRLTRHLVHAGLDGLVVCGTTGEPATLSADEKARVLSTVQAAAPELPLVMGVTGVAPAVVAGECRHWAAQGVAGLLVPPPAYVRPSQQGIVHFYEHVAAEAGRPLIVYDIPYRTGVTLSALGYYPNLLAPDAAAAKLFTTHLLRVIDAAAELKLGVVNTFLGRNRTLSVDANWGRMVETWQPILKHAEARGIKIGIENCPMFFSKDEWPNGDNLAVSPAIWRRMFADLKSSALGLNYDPSHLIWQQMDPAAPLKEFGSRVVHVHAKDARVDREKLNDVGILASPLEYHSPKLPGLGDVDWRRFFAALTDTGFSGAVCVEVEDRAYEHSTDGRIEALKQSAQYLRQFVVG